PPRVAATPAASGRDAPLAGGVAVAAPLGDGAPAAVARDLRRLGCGGQAVAVAGALRQPARVGLRVLPRDADHGIVLGLVETGSGPVARREQAQQRGAGAA